MALTYSDSVLDFDLNILHQPGNETSLPIQNIKQNKAVLRLKERIISTDSVINRYSNKKLQLHESQEALRKWKQEFQQARLNYTDALKKVADLENDLQRQKLEIEKLNQINVKLCIEKDQCETANLALHSHINQLQVLIKKHEEQIKKLESGNENFKKPKTTVSRDDKLKQEQNKSISLWLQQKKILLNHIQIFRTLIMENKKPNKSQKQILKKYENSQDGNFGSVNGGSDSVEEEPAAAQDGTEKTAQIHCQPLEQGFNSVKEINIGYNGNTLETYVNSSQVGTKEKVIIEVSRNNLPTDFDAESEISNEAAYSVDTGCGSSLASSDIEKGFFSPEYSENNSPLSIDSLLTEKDITKVVNASTSPITVLCVQDVGTSPVKFFDCKSVGIQLDATHEEPKVDKSFRGIEVQCDILSKVIQPIDKLCKNVEVQYDRLPKELESLTNQSKCVGIQHDEIKSCLTVGTQADFVVIETNPNKNQDSILSTETQTDSPNISDKKKQHKLSNKQQNLAVIIEEKSVQDEMDFEVTTILQEMRLGFDKISPISSTPNARIGTSQSISRSQPDLDIISQVLGLTQTLKNVTDVMNKHGMIVPIVNDIFAVLQKNTASAEHNVPSSSDYNVNEIINEEISHKNMEVVEIVSNYQNTSDLYGSECVSSQSRSIPQTTDNLEYSSYHKQNDNQDLKVQNINSTISTRKESTCLNKNHEHQNNGNGFCKSRKQNKIKRDKITRLQKIRKSVMPKFKIRKETTALSRKMFVKPVIHTDNENIKPDQILKDKTAYEKALRVITEIRQKEKDTLAKKLGKKTILLKRGLKSKPMLVSEKRSLAPDVQICKNDLIDNNVDTEDDKQEQDNATVTKPSTSLFLPMTPINQKTSHENVSEQISKKKFSLTNTNKDTNESFNNNDSSQGIIQSDKLALKLKGHAPGKQKKKNVETGILSLENKSIKKQKQKSRSNIGIGMSNIIKIQNNSKDYIKRTFVKENEKSLADIFEPQGSSTAIRQSNRLAKKRLSLDIDNRNIKRVKKYSLSSIDFTPQDDIILPSNNSTSKQNTKVNEFKIHAVQNNSVVQLDRLPEEVNLHTKQKCETKLNVTGKNIDNMVNSHNENERTSVKCYNDLDIFTENTEHDYETLNINENQDRVTQRGYFCSILEKYVKIKKKKHKPLSETTIRNVYMKLFKNIGNIIILESKDVNGGLKTCAESFQDVDPKHFVSAVIAFLQTPKKEEDTICKAATPPAPPMAKSEQVLLYVINHLRTCWPNIDLFSMIMSSIEYKLFILNSTAPTFPEVESLSHFYAVLCRYTRDKNRLRMFIVDAMYCLSYKAIAVVQQCLDVWMHILPLAHTGLAKSPLVMTLVYLLHFYRCEDRSGRVQNLRFVLNKRYAYEMSDWNEMKILEMLKDAIVHLREIPIEKKLLRMCLIVVAKRHGVEWCQKNIVKRLLVPRIEDAATPERVRCFCVGVLGSVLRPYPTHMRVHAEIALNRLFVMFDQNNSPQLQEAIFTSMIYLSRHNLMRVIETLLSWRPQKVSPALEALLRDFVRDRTFKSWQYLVSKAAK